MTSRPTSTQLAWSADLDRIRSEREAATGGTATGEGTARSALRVAALSFGLTLAVAVLTGAVRRTPKAD